MGKRFVPTDDQRRIVETLAAYGHTQPEIADIIGKSEATLKRHFKNELRNGKPKANAKVAEALYKTATTGKGSAQVTAAMFWLKTQARWTTNDTVNVNLPQQGAHLADLRNLSSEELRALEAITRRLEAESRPEESPTNRLEGEPNGAAPLN